MTTHFKDHLIPLPVRGQPDLMRLRVGGVLFTGPREDMDAISGAVQARAAGIAGDEAVDAFKRQQYEDLWLPKLRRKTVPKDVPDWAREMYDAGEAAA